VSANRQLKSRKLERVGSLSAPGSLNGMTAVVPGGQTLELPDEPLAEYAVKHGLKQTATRPSLVTYLRELWQRRHFITGFATARNIAMYTEARLGQVWQVLTPLLNAAVYYLVFGVLLGTSRGIPDFVSFLVTGIFVFNFTQRALITSSRVMRDSLPLMRALYFPRACLPFGYVLIELQQLILSFAVLFVIVVLAGEPVTPYWLLIIPALAMQSVFNVGVGFILARWGAGFDDVSQLLPFIVRTWFYFSGIIFSIQSLALTLTRSGTGTLHPRISPHLAYLLQINPAAVYIDLVRYALLEKYRASLPGTQPYDMAKCHAYRLAPALHVDDNYSAYCHSVVPSISHLWIWGAGWAVLAIGIGFIFFWRAEARYGRG
jgi:teichoic acid transport system permease protein